MSGEIGPPGIPGMMGTKGEMGDLGLPGPQVRYRKFCVIPNAPLLCRIPFKNLSFINVDLFLSGSLYVSMFGVQFRSFILCNLFIISFEDCFVLAKIPPKIFPCGISKYFPLFQLFFLFNFRKFDGNFKFKF